MKKSLQIGLMLAVLGGLLSGVMASDAVEPAAVTITNFRDEAVANVSAVEYYYGASLTFTNCVLYAGSSTSSALQGLTDVTVEVRIGNTTTNDAWTGTTISTAGVWGCQVTVPEFTGYTYVQIKCTDANTNIYIYPWKILNRKAALE